MKTQLFYILIISLCAPLTNIYCQRQELKQERLEPGEYARQQRERQQRAWQAQLERCEQVEIELKRVRAQLEELEPHRRAPQVQQQQVRQEQAWAMQPQPAPQRFSRQQPASQRFSRQQQQELEQEEA
jgi:hypothetical protein